MSLLILTMYTPSEGLIKVVKYDDHIKLRDEYNALQVSVMGVVDETNAKAQRCMELEARVAELEARVNELEFDGEVPPYIEEDPLP